MKKYNTLDRKYYKHVLGASVADGKRCVNLWLRHLLLLDDNIKLQNIKTVTEVGCGVTLGMGLAAIISGVDKYYGCDVEPYANTNANLAAFDAIINAYKQKETIPAENLNHEFYIPVEFPHHILGENFTPSENLYSNIKSDLINGHNNIVNYVAPWNDDASIFPQKSSDLIISNAVMEHVDDLNSVYHAMNVWLKPDGYISHCVDFRSHGLFPGWNGHWTASPQQREDLAKSNPFLINYQPLSAHINIIKHNGFEIIKVIRSSSKNNLTRDQLGADFKDLSDEDLNTETAWIIAKKTRDT